jgi:hypothetical protein
MRIGECAEELRRSNPAVAAGRSQDGVLKQPLGPRPDPSRVGSVLASQPATRFADERLLG